MFKVWGCRGSGDRDSGFSNARVRDSGARDWGLNGFAALGMWVRDLFRL